MSNDTKILFPFYQIKAAGVVVEHTNKVEAADRCFREATRPAEMWEVQANGAAKLLRRTGS